MPNTIAQNLARLQAARTAIGAAITAKGGTVASGDGLEEFATDIGTIPSGGGGGGTTPNAVNFYDYDGTIVNSYSAADFAQLSAMPSNPTHAGLTAQGWNWSLTDAKAYVASYGKLDIGQMYVTSDGKTRFYFIASENANVELHLTLGADTELDIDWGDGSEHTRWTSDDGDESKSHDYTSAGRYVIAIEVVTGEFYLSDSISDMYKIEIGNSVTHIGDYAFSERYTLSSITISDSVTEIGYQAFSSCYALSSITIPNSVTEIGNAAFESCYALSSITIPDGITSIGENAFYECHALSSITIPDGVTEIGYQAFESCYALSSITIPNSVTSISGRTFSSCYALSSITFGSSTPPNLSGDLGLVITCIIRVPQGSLTAYTSAPYYPDPSVCIYEEY